MTKLKSITFDQSKYITHDLITIRYDNYPFIYLPIKAMSMGLFSLLLLALKPKADNCFQISQFTRKYL